jgi:hypothetical protein
MWSPDLIMGFPQQKVVVGPLLAKGVTVTGTHTLYGW